jgi:hypothetical protein
MILAEKLKLAEKKEEEVKDSAPEEAEAEPTRPNADTSTNSEPSCMAGFADEDEEWD